MDNLRVSGCRTNFRKVSVFSARNIEISHIGKEWTVKADSKPDKLFNECVKQAAVAERSVGQAMRNRQQTRKAMYRAAVSYQRLTQEHHEYFLGQAERVGGIDALLQGWFKPLAFLGEDWQELLRDVAEGVTEKEYLSSTAGSFTRRRKVAKLLAVEPVDSPLPIEPEASLPPEELIASLKEQNDTLREQVKIIPGLRRLLAQQERRIHELEGFVNKTGKSAMRLKAV